MSLTRFRIKSMDNGMRTFLRVDLTTERKRRRQLGFMSMMMALPVPLPRKTMAISVQKLIFGLLNFTNNRLPVTAINTYRKVKRMARILTLRLRFLVVRMMRMGAERITAKATNCNGEMVSPKNIQPSTRYRIGANWMKMPRLVELSISSAR